MFKNLTYVRNQSYVTYKMKTIRIFSLLCGLTTMTDIYSDNFNIDSYIKNISKMCNQNLEELPYWETIQDVFMNIKIDELGKIKLLLLDILLIYILRIQILYRLFLQGEKDGK